MEQSSLLSIDDRVTIISHGRNLGSAGIEKVTPNSVILQKLILSDIPVVIPREVKPNGFITMIDHWEYYKYVE